MTVSPADRSAPLRRAPRPLAAAAAIAALEGVALIAEGLSLLPAMDRERLAMGTTSLLFFLIYGGGLVWCARQLHRLQSWARAPIVLAQLIQFMVGVSFWGGSTTLVAVVLMALAVATVVGIFHPASLAALDSAEE